MLTQYCVVAGLHQEQGIILQHQQLKSQHSSGSEGHVANEQSFVTAATDDPVKTWQPMPDPIVHVGRDAIVDVRIVLGYASEPVMSVTLHN